MNWLLVKPWEVLIREAELAPSQVTFSNFTFCFLLTAHFRSNDSLLVIQCQMIPELAELK